MEQDMQHKPKPGLRNYQRSAIGAIMSERHYPTRPRGYILWVDDDAARRVAFHFDGIFSPLYREIDELLRMLKD